MAELSVFLQTSEQSTIYVNTSTSGSYAVPVWSELDLIETVEMNTDHDKKEVKPRRCTRKGVKANLIGLNDFSGTLEAYVPAVGATGESVDAINVIREAAEDRSPVDLLFIDGAAIDTTVAAKAKRVICGIGKSRSESGDDPTKESFTFHFVPNGSQEAPVRGTVIGGTFTAA